MKKKSVNHFYDVRFLLQLH
uniref:Ubinuclein-1 isoform X2 n=1 Tax=Rhizophora mucronata TaxID=61149 RepID=A0A2P2P094_RHIMU